MGVKICPRDGFALVLDTEIVRQALDAGWPAVALYRCRLGHSVREWPDAQPTRRLDGRPCCVCGLALPPNRRKFHAGRCQEFGYRASARWHQQHPGEAFIVERAPWYLGPLYAPTPLPPLDPLAGRMPRDWAEGWLRVYGLEQEVAA